MLISVIVTNYKTPDLLKLCLRSVKGAAVNLEHEIIVVDSQAQEETEEFFSADFPEAKYRPFKKNLGYARMVNKGLVEAKGDYLFILNADIILTVGSLKKIIDYLETHKEVGLLGPQLLSFDGSAQESCFRFYWPSTVLYRRTFLGRTRRGRLEISRFLMKDFDKKSIKEVDWLLGAALVTSRSALARVGPMDERFFLYFEDVDWCRRFWENGYKIVYFPEAKMHHYHGRISKKAGGMVDLFFNKYTWIHIVSAIKYFWKYRK